MNVQTNIALSDYTTMRLGGPARFFAEATTPDELAALYQNAKRLDQKVFIIGGGSNLIAHDEGFDGLVIHNKIKGFEIIANDDNATIVKLGAGEEWDSVVQRTVDMNLSGIAAMSAIPGTVGAAPVQNVGAYGQEIADVFISLEAYDTHNDAFVTLDWDSCHFSYRDSIFRSEAKGHYGITSVTIKLSKAAPAPPFYAALQKYLDLHNITDYTPQIIREAVTAIRASKLPDPKVLPNSGSFFKNAVVENWVYNDLKTTYPDMPAFQMDETHYKIPSGWLIEQADFKGQTLHGIKVHSDNALVLINESATGYQDLADARQEVISGVQDKFRITIEQEPLEIG